MPVEKIKISYSFPPLQVRPPSHPGGPGHHGAGDRRTSSRLRRSNHPRRGRRAHRGFSPRRQKSLPTRQSHCKWFALFSPLLISSLIVITDVSHFNKELKKERKRIPMYTSLDNKVMTLSEQNNFFNLFPLD